MVSKGGKKSPWKWICRKLILTGAAVDPFPLALIAVLAFIIIPILIIPMDLVGAGVGARVLEVGDAVAVRVEGAAEPGDEVGAGESVADELFFFFFFIIIIPKLRLVCGKTACSSCSSCGCSCSWP